MHQKKITAPLGLLLLCSFFTGLGIAADLFEKSEHMIPMRDGVKLHTVVFAPKERRAPLPILFVRTPYGAPADERGATGSYEYLIEDGYILAFQDIRGRF